MAMVDVDGSSQVGWLGL